MSIDQRLQIYGPSICVCGNRKETVFFGRYQLTCRDHPGHPLYRSTGPGAVPNAMESTAPGRMSDSV